MSEGNTDKKKKLYDELFNLYYVRLSYYAHTFIDDFDVCRDIVQDLFMKLWELKLENFTEVELQKYIYKSIKNRCFDYQRKSKVRQDSRQFILEQILNQEELFFSVV